MAAHLLGDWSQAVSANAQANGEEWHPLTLPPCQIPPPPFQVGMGRARAWGSKMRLSPNQRVIDQLITCGKKCCLTAWIVCNSARIPGNNLKRRH